MVTLWETAEQARRPLGEYGQSFLRALPNIAAISTGNRTPMSIWQVNARV